MRIISVWHKSVGEDGVWNLENERVRTDSYLTGIQGGITT